MPVVNTGWPWTKDDKDIVVHCSSHVLASVTFKQFLSDELLDMVAHDYWIMLPYSMVCHLPSLKIAPAGMVPQLE